MHPFSSLLLRITGALALALTLPLAAQAQTAEVCGPTVKEQFAVAMDAIDKKFGPDETNPDTGLPKPNPEKENEESQVYKQFSFCGLNQPLPTLAYFNGVRNCAASHNAALSGSSFFEDMACCGYDPQKREFACPVRIKQNFGFGGSPFPGSREWVLNCVFSPTAGAYLPVALGSVHLSNSGDQPPWMFGVTANAVANLFTVLPLNQATARARSILSWNAPPRSCNYKPIWGNTIEYRIRRDQ
jgi:hypothetical protein